MNNQIYKGINQSFQGFYRVGIVNPTTDECVWKTDWQKNLILNQGMHALYTQYIADVLKIGVAGVGSRPNSIGGGTSQISQSGTLAYLSVTTGLADFTSSNGTYAASVQVGDMIKYSNNSESMVVSVTNGFNLVTSQSYTFNPGLTFDIWKTSQAGLEGEVARAGTGVAGSSYSTATGQCTTNEVVNVRTWQRTYDFPVEVGSVGYQEMGVSWATSGATTVFSRILLPSVITVDTGFRLRLQYQLQGTFTPATPQYKTASIGNWPVAPSTNTIGSESIQNFHTSVVNSDGSTTATLGVLDPAYTTAGGFISSIWGSPSSTALSAFGTGSNRAINGAFTTTAMSKAAYAGNFSCDKTGVLTTGQLNRTDIRSIGIGPYGSGMDPYDADGNAVAFVFNQTQSKSSIQTLSFTYRWTWGRTLA